MIARKHASSPSADSRSSAGRKWLVVALILFAVGGLVGFTYGQAAGTVSHAFSEVIWGTVTNAGQAVNFLKDIKKGSPGDSGNVVYNPDNPTHGINADFLDGLDSSFFLGAGGGSGTSTYSTFCSWMTTELSGSTAGSSPFQLFHNNCQGPDGVDLTGAAANPPACAAGWTSQAVNWYPVGISQWSPGPVLQHGLPGCLTTCTDSLIFEYPGGASGSGVAPVVVNVVGVGERICVK